MCMKNFISYYYQFHIHELFFHDGKYFFSNGKDRYLLEICTNMDIFSYYNELQSQLEKYAYFFRLVPNIEKSYITWVDKKPYILLKLSSINNDKISIFDIKSDLFIEGKQNLLTLNHFPWSKLWEQKIDYFEEWFATKMDSYKNFYPIFHYFIGISENALLYLKETEREIPKEDSDRLVFAHHRLTVNDGLFDYYNPCNIMIDHASRDISEYIKSMFINKLWDFDLVKSYLERHYFSKYGLRVMLSRILFPSFFFDYIEKMIVDNQKLDLLYLEARIEEFEAFVREISLYFSEQYHVSVVPWIIKRYSI